MRPLLTDLAAIFAATVVVVIFVGFYVWVEAGIRAGDIQGMTPAANLALMIACAAGAWIFAPLSHSTVRRRLRRAERLRRSDFA